MSFPRHRRFRLAALALLASLLPISQATAGSTAPSGDEPLFYLFHAEPLGHPAGTVSARFEYRSGERVLGADEVSLSFGGDDTLLVPIPRSLPALRSGGEVPDLKVLVFADGLLLEEFDRGSLLAYDRVLRSTHAEAIRALSMAVHQLGSKPIPTDPIMCGSPCGGGCGPFDDYDCDGVNNITDNCTDDYNPGQQNCDGDAVGDACDGSNGIFQPSGPVDTCMTDKDDHFVYITFEHHVEQLMVDVSSCGSPPHWNRWVRMDNDCIGLGDFDCCIGLRLSIVQVFDDPIAWCTNLRNQDFCH